MANVKITVRPNGPYRVEGDVDLVDQEGNPIRKSEPGFSLCRCGHSNTKPLCDKSHARVGFLAETAAPVVVPTPEPALRITTTPKLEE